MIQRLVYLVVILLIGLISVYDNTLTLLYGDQIHETERNPVGNWLLGIGDVPLFILTKSVLTICAIFICILVARTKYRVALFGVLFFQVCLFWWLTFSGEGGGPDDQYSPFIFADVFRFFIYGSLP